MHYEAIKVQYTQKELGRNHYSTTQESTVNLQTTTIAIIEVCYHHILHIINITINIYHFRDNFSYHRPTVTNIAVTTIATITQLVKPSSTKCVAYTYYRYP